MYYTGKIQTKIVSFFPLKHSWNEQRASEVVRRANPDEDKQSIANLSKLLLQIRALICKFKLTVCITTKYTRIALQSSANNQFRLTIDKDVTVINERSSGSKNSISGSWCLENSECDIISKDAIKLPYCVYEVKVASTCNAPSFVSDLELEMDEAIFEAKKFSKFLSGASLFNSKKVRTLPWWAAEAAFVK